MLLATGSVTFTPASRAWLKPSSSPPIAYCSSICMGGAGSGDCGQVCTQLPASTATNYSALSQHLDDLSAWSTYADCTLSADAGVFVCGVPLQTVACTDYSSGVTQSEAFPNDGGGNSPWVTEVYAASTDGGTYSASIVMNNGMYWKDTDRDGGCTCNTSDGSSCTVYYEHSDGTTNTSPGADFDRCSFVYTVGPVAKLLRARAESTATKNSMNILFVGHAVTSMGGSWDHSAGFFSVAFGLAQTRPNAPTDLTYCPNPGATPVSCP